MGKCPPKFQGVPCPHCMCITMSATIPSTESGPPPVKKLTKTTLSFHTTTQLESSTPLASHSENNPDLEDTDIPHPGEEIVWSSRCCTSVCDVQEFTSFQPKDLSTIKSTQRKQGQNCLYCPRSYSRNVYVYLALL